MLSLTDRDLEYLASLQKGWRSLYLSEVARLMKEDGDRAHGKILPYHALKT